MLTIPISHTIFYLCLNWSNSFNFLYHSWRCQQASQEKLARRSSQRAGQHVRSSSRTNGTDLHDPRPGELRVQWRHHTPENSRAPAQSHRRQRCQEHQRQKGIIKLRIKSNINCVLISVFFNLFKNKTIEDKSESEALWSTLSFI